MTARSAHMIDYSFMDGLREGRIETDVRDFKKGIEGMLGGKRFFVSKSRQLTYDRKEALLLRTVYPTICGYSGSAVLRAGNILTNTTLREWRILGFQSHEYNAPATKLTKEYAPPLFWKIALKPPEKLKTLYPLAPHSQLHKLEQIYERKYFRSIPLIDFRPPIPSVWGVGE